MLNAAILSVMGRLRISRGCVLVQVGDEFVADGKLCKGVAPFRTAAFPLLSIERCSEDRHDHAEICKRGFTKLVPLTTGRGLLGVLALGDMYEADSADASVDAYLELVGMLAATAAQNAEMVRSLVDAKKELEARNLLVTSLFETARDFTGAKSRNELLRILSYRLMGQLMVSSYALYLVEPLDGEQVIGNRAGMQHLADLYPDILALDTPVITSHLSVDHPVRKQLDQAGVGMAAPLIVHGKTCGVLAVPFKLNAQPFTSNEVRFLEAIGNTAMVAIENVRLYEQELEKRQLENELRIAADIQRSLMPLQLPHIPGLEIAADARSSRHVGGDYFDVIKLDDSRTLFVIADVAGKGVPAALLMANVQAAINVLAALDLPLDQLALRLNSLVHDNTDPEVFISMFICVVNTQTMVVEYVNAGHNPPVVVKEAQVAELDKGGVLLGVIAKPPAYAIGTCTLAPGDVLVMYTDGVVEARQGLQEYGLMALTSVVKRVRLVSATEVVRTIQQEVRQFTGSDVLVDDTSLLVLKVLER